MSIKIDLKGKNILITGANGGIGQEITLRFLQSGANCICVDKNFDNLKSNKFLKTLFNRITFLKCNFEKKNFINTFIKNIKRNKKKIDVLINSAGASSSKNFFNYNLDDWNKTLKINLTTPFLVSQAISKNYMNNNSCIINITSLAAELGFPNNVAYVASKGGLKQLTKAMAIDLKNKKIRVNSVGPGYVRTKMTEKSWSDKIKKKLRSERMISERWAHPRDIANVCVFLGSELADYINGQDIYVDGGWLAKGLTK